MLHNRAPPCYDYAPEPAEQADRAHQVDSDRRNSGPLHHPLALDLAPIISAVAGSAETLSEAFNALAIGLGMTALIDPRSVPDRLLGDIVTLVYDGLLAPSDAVPPDN